MLTVPNNNFFDFKEEQEINRWRIVNDGVMGGLSQGKILWNQPENTMIWSGKVSLENNGGFTSIRTTPELYKVGDFEKIILRVKGDGTLPDGFE